jgi:hypothetical protein
VPQHVRVHAEWKLCSDRKTGEELAEACRCHRRAAHGHKHKPTRIIIALECAQCPQLFPTDLLHRRDAALHSAHVHHALRKIDLIPRQGTELDNPQAMPERNEDQI